MTTTGNPLKIIRTEQDYEVALQRIDEIFDAKLGTPEFEELEILSLLVEKYEEDNYPIDFPDPIEAIKFKMDQLGIQSKDLVEAIGYKSRVSEILNKKRKLTLEMIRNLSSYLKLPANILIKDYQ